MIDLVFRIQRKISVGKFLKGRFFKIRQNGGNENVDRILQSFKRSAE